MKLVPENLKSVEFEELIKNEEMLKIVLDLMKNKAKELKFNSLEIPKKVTLVPKPFIDYDCVTTSFKLKRHQSKLVFKGDIERMYGTS